MVRVLSRGPMSEELRFIFCCFLGGNRCSSVMNNRWREKIRRQRMFFLVYRRSCSPGTGRGGEARRVASILNAGVAGALSTTGEPTEPKTYFIAPLRCFYFLHSTSGHSYSTGKEPPAEELSSFERARGARGGSGGPPADTAIITCIRRNKNNTKQ